MITDNTQLNWFQYAVACFQVRILVYFGVHTWALWGDYKSLLLTLKVIYIWLNTLTT